MENTGLALEIRVRGKQLREFSHNGRTYIEAKKGSEYVVRARNNTHCRVLAIPGVDGLSVMNGEPANFNESGGYIIEPWSHLDIPGWSLDDESVAKFKFGHKATSYLAKTEDGKARNAGVIGVAFFQERVEPVWYVSNVGSKCLRGQTFAGAVQQYGASTDDLLPKDNVTISSTGDGSREFAGVTHTCLHSEVCTPNPPQTAAQCGDAEVAVDHDLGTEFGKREEFQTHSVSFIRATNNPHVVLELHYATRKALLEAGVRLSGKRQVFVPQAFQNRRGCSPPKGWKGRV